ncbi:ribonuclease J [Paenibacillus cellulosilyticus]|uniref:Ribonuclease J n=2 Tax=Paenibacillus cellulosilyticus TaxID=375489 RepID=A0A2V2YU34_9BACL|nr:ribonuclease J [Paenibacillus cellulosilyticus]PWV99363.1 ribonuclease J [Paenibacillus cellulosilyticus]QKS45127.1 ribonuclease J [Paenibacillus cellulosilyticus]
MTANDRLSIIPLGGVNEIGKNMYVIQCGDDLVVVDCGSKFPDESLLGIDVIIPDITYLIENESSVRGLVVTHGHEDHIGGIPYIIKQLNMPIYATRLTLGLIKAKLKEHGLLSSTKLHQIDAQSEIALGQLPVSFFSTNHSIPDCLGVVFHTPQGTIVHTGDFKFDLTPVNNQYADIHKMAEIGKNGVLALLSESTNAERPGFTPSERLVGANIHDAFTRAEGMIYITTFASNVHRLQQIIDAAAKTNRKVTLAGRSMVNVVDIASRLGYLTVPQSILVEADEANKYKRDEMVVLCTGSQGEPMAALGRIASGNHRQFGVSPGDTVIFASSPIPGNERNVARIVDNLFEKKARVIYGAGSNTGMHVSGHASQEELKLMLTLMKPQYFIPIHGEYRMLHLHQLLAESVGVEASNIFILNNGDVVDFAGSEAFQERNVPNGDTYVDGLGIGDVGNIVLRDRKVLSADGILIIVITFGKGENKIISGPDIISRGFVFAKESEGLMDEVSRITLQVMEQRLETKLHRPWGLYKREVKEAVGNFLYAKTKRRPMILPIIIQV